MSDPRQPSDEFPDPRFCDTCGVELTGYDDGVDECDGCFDAQYDDTGCAPEVTI